MTRKQEAGKRLAAMRKALGISARRMSLDIGKNAGYIRRIERGRTWPSSMTVLHICAYLYAMARVPRA